MLTHKQATKLINNEGCLLINSETGYMKVQKWDPKHPNCYLTHGDFCISKVKKLNLIYNDEWFEGFERRDDDKAMSDYDNWQDDWKEIDKKYFIPSEDGFLYNDRESYFIDMTAEEFVNAYNEGKKWRMKRDNKNLKRLIDEL